MEPSNVTHDYFLSTVARVTILSSWTYFHYITLSRQLADRIHGLLHHLMYVIHLIILHVDKRLHALQTLVPYCILTRRTVTYSLSHRIRSTCADRVCLTVDSTINCVYTNQRGLMIIIF